MAVCVCVSTVVIFRKYLFWFSLVCVISSDEQGVRAAYFNVVGLFIYFVFVLLLFSNLSVLTWNLKQRKVNRLRF